MGLTIDAFPAGHIGTNAYLVADTDARDAIIVDAPQGVANAIVAAAEGASLRITRIVITHGHWDHIDGLAELQQRISVPTAGHAGVRERIEHPEAARTPFPVVPARLTEELAEGDTVAVGRYIFDVMELPGHDSAHIGLYCAAEHVFMGGDVLFRGGYGRTDVPGSDYRVMIQMLNRLLGLPLETRVYPGHGDPTTIGNESSWIVSISRE